LAPAEIQADTTNQQFWKKEPNQIKSEVE